MRQRLALALSIGLVAALGVAPATQASDVMPARVYFGEPPRAFTSPPGNRCEFSLDANFKRGTKVVLQFAAAPMVMPWEEVDPNDYKWKRAAKSRVKRGQATFVIKAEQDGYWRLVAKRKKSTPWYLDVWPTSDLVGDIGPDDLNCPNPAPRGVLGTTTIERDEGAAALDSRIIRKLRVRDHTAAVRKIKVSLTEISTKTVWTSTWSRTSQRMTWFIRDPKHVAGQFRFCFIDQVSDYQECDRYNLRVVGGKKSNFWIRETAKGWRVRITPVWQPRSRAQCDSLEYWRPRIKWSLRVVDPRNGGVADASSVSFKIRCYG